MSLTSQQTTTYTITGTCDQCQVVKTWQRASHINDEATPMELGFEMRDPRLYRSPDGVLWFHESSCLHRWVDANLVEYLRHPELVQP